MNTHAGKAESYEKGRPDYPEAFFDFLYGEAGFRPGQVIADIGCGTGKVTKHFLARGGSVVAIEPDGDMLRIAMTKLSGYPNCQLFQGYAEDTGLAKGAIDHIFCGNAYHWFARDKTVPEFRRILREGGSVAIATLGGGNDVSAFLPGTFQEKTFTYVIHETPEQYLHGLLSVSSAPLPGDDAYEAFCSNIQTYFNKHSRNGALKVEMQLHCVIGGAENLAI